VKGKLEKLSEREIANKRKKKRDQSLTKGKARVVKKGGAGRCGRQEDRGEKKKKRQAADDREFKQGAAVRG